MVAATTCSSEAERLRALHDCAVLATSPEPSFDDLAATAALVCDVPFSLISVVDGDRPWFKSRFGFESAATPPSGYRVRAAAEGAEAVSIYSKHAKEIALVLTDMMMPVMDGPATIPVSRRLNPTVKIFAASGLTASGNVAKAASLSVTDFPAKPCTAETMLGMSREVLDGTPNPAAIDPW